MRTKTSIEAEIIDVEEYIRKRQDILKCIAYLLDFDEEDLEGLEIGQEYVDRHIETMNDQKEYVESSIKEYEEKLQELKEELKKMENEE